MNRRTVWLVLGSAWCVSTGLRAQTISWFSDANATNLDSFGVPMDDGFQFQLGVFTNGFQPKAGNMASWLEHWSEAQTTSYNSTGKRFAETYEVMTNAPPFEAGAAGWIFGRRVGTTGSEWILFRASGWTWPAVEPVFPSTYFWDAKDATEVVLGTIHSDRTPFLMQSVLVRSYQQWQTLHTTGGPNEDPDLDGMSNLLEFVFGTNPKTVNAPVATPVTLQSGYPVITIPRRIDHLVKCTVEVSGDLVTWNSGPAFTEVVQDDSSALVVRDLTPLNSANPKRFLRLKATLP
jgi:hypothetical protein